MADRDPRDEKWEGRADRAYSDFTERPARTLGKWFAIIAVICVSLALLFGAIGFIGGWFNKAAEVAGPANVSRQFQEVITGWKGMEQAAINACEAETATNTGDGASAIIEDPAFAYRSQYRNIEVDFNAAQNDIFRAGVVGPGGYPDNAPAIDAMIARLTNEGQIAPGTCAAAR